MLYHNKTLGKINRRQSPQDITMAKKQNSNQKKPRDNEMVETRKSRMKEALLNVFKEMPIVEVAVKRIGITKDTYYRWLKEDEEFGKKAKEAMARGIEFINDMSESQIIALIKERKMSSIRYWLRHNHPKYAPKLEITATFKPYEAMNDEQRADFNKAMELASMPEIDIKVDEGFETMNPKKESETQTDEEKPPPETENTLDKNGLYKIIESDTIPEKIENNPVRVRQKDKTTTFYPNGERFVKMNNGSSCIYRVDGKMAMHEMYQEAEKKKQIASGQKSDDPPPTNDFVCDEVYDASDFINKNNNK